MAQRRMFSPQIIDSDAFLDMPLSAQALYFHLAMRADDDGFVDNTKRILRLVGGNDDDLKLLVAKRFILTFESGVIVIKHWRIHNLIRADRYKPTAYLEEKNRLTIKENGAYTEVEKPNGNQMATSGTRRLGKVRLGKDRERGAKAPTPAEDVRDFFDSKFRQEELISALVEKGVPEAVARDELQKFISYWTERNKTGTKERWEMEKTFELNRRLSTWFRNVNKFTPRQRSTQGRGLA